MNMLDPELLSILVCPKCKGEMKYDANEHVLICDHCRLKYDVKDGIPVLLIDEAKAY
jgi:uncharacterized protein